MAQVRIDASQIEGLKEDMANGYYEAFNQTFLNAFQTEVPVDTGRLKGRHSADGRPRKRGRYWTLRWKAPTGYDLFVHQGTGVYVTQRRTAVRLSRRLRTVRLASRGRGQRANPWMSRTFRRLGLKRVRWIGGYN